VQLAIGRGVSTFAVIADVARGHGVIAEECVEQGRLSRSGRAEQGKGLTGGRECTDCVYSDAAGNADGNDAGPQRECADLRGGAVDVWVEVCLGEQDGWLGAALPREREQPLDASSCRCRMAGLADGQDVDVGRENLLLTAARLNGSSGNGIAAGEDALEPGLVTLEPEDDLVANAGDRVRRLAGRRCHSRRPRGPGGTCCRQNVADASVDAADPALRRRGGRNHAAKVGAVAPSALLDYWWNT
jgi:hypothetical protein